MSKTFFASAGNSGAVAQRPASYWEQLGNQVHPEPWMNDPCVKVTEYLIDKFMNTEAANV